MALNRESIASGGNVTGCAKQAALTVVRTGLYFKGFGHGRESTAIASQRAGTHEGHREQRSPATALYNNHYT